MQALWGELWTARSVLVDGNEVMPFRRDVTDLWLLAKQCTVTHAVKARPRREKTKWRCRQGFLLVRFETEDSIPRTGCFLSAFLHLLRTLSKEVSRSTATKVESGISDANRRFLVCERRVKKDKTLVEKSRSSLSQLRAAEHPMQLVKKQKTGLYGHQSRKRNFGRQSLISCV